MNKPAFLLLFLCTFAGGVYADTANLNLAEDRGSILVKAREMIQADPFMTLITVDEHGQPHARTMEHSPPDESMVIYFSTIPGTRKLAQIQGNPKVTLYFDGPGDVTYLSIVGRATIHTDPDTIAKHSWRPADARARFWPNFPENYVLIKVEPRWLELVAPDIKSRDSDWHPQSVVFE